MMHHKARKRFGQNFLVDFNIVRAIVRAIAPQPADNLVEIGPGLGALTRPLLERVAHLHAVELDRDIVARLAQEFPPEKLTLHQADALRFDFASLGENLRVVGNLPYNISTPLLFHLSECAHCIRDIHAMLQKEVVERMVARPSTPDYGRLSVMLQYRFAMEKLIDVPADAFQPAPKVQSAFVRITPYAAKPHPARDETLLAQIVAAAFGQRRKTLRNTLKAYLAGSDFAVLEIDPSARAENLGVAEFVRIAEHVAARMHG